MALNKSQGGDYVVHGINGAPNLSQFKRFHAEDRYTAFQETLDDFQKKRDKVSLSEDSALPTEPKMSETTYTLYDIKQPTRICNEEAGLVAEPLNLTFSSASSNWVVFTAGNRT
jgi:hypothetical protein